MYCPNCGKAEQESDSYCRHCGEFLPDFSNSYSYLIRKFLGRSKPETQVTVNLVISLVTSAISVLLLLFLNGYFDAQQTRTGGSTPPVIYFVYTFLGLVATWQFLSLLIGLNLKMKLSQRKKGELTITNASEVAARPGADNRSLPPADVENIVPPSVTEDTTKLLGKARDQ